MIQYASLHAPVWMVCVFVALVVGGTGSAIVLVRRARVRAVDLRRFEASLPRTPGLEQPDGHPDHAVEARQDQVDRDRRWPFRMQHR